MSDTANTAPKWMSRWLIAAAIYNIAWGALTVLYPNWLFDLTGMEPPAYPFIWQCVGMIVGVYGVGYWAAAFDPYRHWPIVLVGFLGKIFGPMGYVSGLLLGGKVPGINAVPPEFGVTLLTNDLIWWVPFFLMLFGAFRHAQRGSYADATDPASAMSEFTDAEGVTLLERTNRSKTLVVFLRHSGCTFCKEALADLKAKRSQIESDGTRIALVSMTPQDQAMAWLDSYGLADVPHFADPERRLYRSFGLIRGTLSQTFGLKSWTRGLAATLQGHAVGKLVGDGFQMPGVFLVERGEIIHAYRHESVADRPDYEAIACETSPASGAASAA
ncbi:MAG: SelL-related redox protein [Planctomycetota bacterium]